MNVVRLNICAAHLRAVAVVMAALCLWCSGVVQAQQSGSGEKKSPRLKNGNLEPVRTQKEVVFPEVIIVAPPPAGGGPIGPIIPTPPPFNPSGPPLPLPPGDNGGGGGGGTPPDPPAEQPKRWIAIACQCEFQNEVPTTVPSYQCPGYQMYRGVKKVFTYSASIMAITDPGREAICSRGIMNYWQLGIRTYDVHDCPGPLGGRTFTNVQEEYTQGNAEQGATPDWSCTGQ
jgi:hypothetical protein